MLYQYSFEPGSTFKVFGLATAIDARRIRSRFDFWLGSFDVNGHTIYDFGNLKAGEITYNEAYVTLPMR